jgi:hypothetical protein
MKPFRPTRRDILKATAGGIALPMLDRAEALARQVTLKLVPKYAASGQFAIAAYSGNGQTPTTFGGSATAYNGRSPYIVPQGGTIRKIAIGDPGVYLLGTPTGTGAGDYPVGPIPNGYTLTWSVEYPSGTILAQGTFNSGGSTSVTASPSTAWASDAITLPGNGIPCGSPWWLRVYLTYSGVLVSSTKSVSTTLHEGWNSTGTDMTMSGTISDALGGIWRPAWVMCYTDSKPLPSISCLGDSIAVSLDDDSSNTNTGIVGRWLCYGSNTIWGTTVAGAQYGVWNFSHGSRLDANLYLNGSDFEFNSNGPAAHSKYMRVALCKNDTVLSIATIKSNFLKTWQYAAEAGCRVVQCTCTPTSSSTNGYQDTTNQTPGTYNSTVQEFNSWCRDSSSNGAISQSGGYLFGIEDDAALLEYGGSSSPQGIWAVPAPIAPYNGTCTSNGTTTTINDTSGNFTTANNRWQWIWFTSGANAGLAAEVSSVGSSSQLTISAMPNPTASGDGYVLYCRIPTDGTHPTTGGYHWWAHLLGSPSSYYPAY